MRKLLITLFVISIQLIACTDYNKDVHENVGKNYTYCGTVQEVFLSNRHAFLNFEGKYPNQKFTGYLPDQGRSFSYDIKSLEGKRVCLNGIVVIYRGRAEIVITKESQIEN